MSKLNPSVYFPRGSRRWFAFRLVFFMVTVAEALWVLRLVGLDHPLLVVRALTNLVLLVFAVPYVAVALLRHRRFGFGFGFWIP